MSETAWYRSWFNSPFYHKLYFERNDKEAADFIDRLVRYLNPSEKSRMLDVACGRGRHSRMLASYGFQVTGFDLSPNNIEYAKKDGNDNPEFFIHDMRLPFMVNYFDYAFNFFTSFGYFETQREHDNAIRTVANGLKQEGFFVIDYLNVHFIEDHLVLNEKKVIDGTKYEIHRWDDEKRFYKKIVISDRSLQGTIDFTEKVSKFGLEDFTEMCSYCGMQIIDVFGDYNLNKYDLSKTPRLIVIARKTRS